VEGKDGIKTRTILQGWNDEFKGNARSRHAEESIAAKLAKDERILLVSIVGQNGLPLAPCGGCREALIGRADNDAAVLMGENLEKADWVPLKALLPNSFDRPYQISEGTEDFALFQQAQKIMGISYSIYTGRYQGAAILTDKGIFAAPIMEEAAYHHLNPIELALSMVYSAGQIRGMRKVLFIDRTTKDEPVFPCGLGRQYLYEAYHVCGTDFEVISANILGRAWATTVSKLLPYPFGPNDLGLTKELTEYRDRADKFRLNAPKIV
jgi:cytidine deaminase